MDLKQGPPKAFVSNRSTRAKRFDTPSVPVLSRGATLPPAPPSLKQTASYGGTWPYVALCVYSADIDFVEPTLQDLVILCAHRAGESTPKAKIGRPSSTSAHMKVVSFDST